MTWLTKGLAWLLSGVILVLVAIWTWSAGLNPYWPFICVVFAGFSLYKSYKAFVEVWRSMLNKRVEILATADKDSCLPGDVVNVSVKVTGKEELDIEEGRVALVCANRYVYQYTTTDSQDGFRSGTRAADQRLQRPHDDGRAPTQRGAQIFTSQAAYSANPCPLGGKASTEKRRAGTWSRRL